MKPTTFLAVLAFFTLVSTSTAGKVKILPAANQIINAGSDIPVSFTALGFPSGSVAQIWLVSTRTWRPAFHIVSDVPIVPGLNTVQAGIAWSWFDTGRYTIRVIVGSNYDTGSTVYTIRSAVTYPYPGWSLPKDSDVVVKWNTRSFIIADFFDVWLHNEVTGEFTLLLEEVDPSLGEVGFHTPDVTGVFSIVIDGFLRIDLGDGDFIDDLTEITQSGLLTIR